MSTIIREATQRAQTHTDKMLYISKVQRTCVHDGPGIRTTIFFKGCALRCLWCQNPENLAFEQADVQSQYRIAEVMNILQRDRLYYQASGGGVTLSGGDPLLQNADALVELLQQLQAAEIPVSLETALHAPWQTIQRVLPYVDLWLIDFKYVGNPDTHKKLTGQEDHRIHENLQRLLEEDPECNIRFRMVMVPGYNDDAAQIRNAAEYLKSLGHTQIELLKYHSMYEDKAMRLGLKIPMLGIQADESLLALKNSIALFQQYGIQAYNDALADAPPKATFTQRVLQVQNDIRESPRAICFEASRLKTEYYKKFKGMRKPTPIHRAERLRHVLQNKTLRVYPRELLVGNFSSKRVAGQVWEEQYGVLYITFLYKVKKQKPVPFVCTRKERWMFYTKVFPFWIKHSIMSRFMELPKLGQGLLTISQVAEQAVGFNNNFAAIAHYIVNFDRLLSLGTTGLKQEAIRAQQKHPENNPDFYAGVLTALDALEQFGDRYAAYLQKVAHTEPDPVRRLELQKMAEICTHVPKNPARTFHEALQSMLLLQVALCTEAYENAISFGRMDQILYPYYKRDLEAGRITYEEAKELLCLFILKMDEIILVNDGDGVLNVGKLFETLSVDQALTFGGVDRDGKDATNDVTYMLLDACELLPLAVNMCARIHKDSPQQYLDRLAALYINGCPMPELFSDAIYLETLQRHYDQPIEDSRNYSIVGCVEPIACDDHFGNTDCANMNLALPMLQALKGHEHDLWNYSRKLQVEKLVTHFWNYIFRRDGRLSTAMRNCRATTLRRRNEKRGMYTYDPPESMDALLSRFQTRLNALAKAILADQQKIEGVLASHFTTPLASSLYRGCLESGKDCYEGGTQYNTAGIQAVGVTDVADSLHAVDLLVFQQKKYRLQEILNAMEENFIGEQNQRIQEDLLAVPKFGDNCSPQTAWWVSKVMEIYNNALDTCPYALRNGKYTAGYYALNTSDRYGKKTQALPSGRKQGVPLANSVTPHYGMEQADLLSALNDLQQVNFTDYAVNGTTVTFTVDAALFPGDAGVRNLATIFRTFLTSGGMQFQPNVINRDILLEAYHNPEKYKYLMVRVAGYCAYFQELSDELKQIIINRTCYS